MNYKSNYKSFIKFITKLKLKFFNNDFTRYKCALVIVSPLSMK